MPSLPFPQKPAPIVEKENAGAGLTSYPSARTPRPARANRWRLCVNNQRCGRRSWEHSHGNRSSVSRQGAQRSDVADLQRLNAAFQRVDARPPAVAARLLGVTKRTIYRRLQDGALEGVPRGRSVWVSVRSLVRALEDKYGPTRDFNVLSELENRDVCDEGDAPPEGS